MTLLGDDLFSTPRDQAEIDFENEGGQTYVCGNPPYSGSRKQAIEQKRDIKDLCANVIPKWKSLDYVAGWIIRARTYMKQTDAECAFVATSSLCEGLQVSVLWRHILQDDIEIRFAVRSFKWANLATNNAGVTVVIVGMARRSSRQKTLFLDDQHVWQVDQISPYLTPGNAVFVDTRPEPISTLPKMVTGAMPRDGGHLILAPQDVDELAAAYPQSQRFIRRYVGSDELINGIRRSCIWVEEKDLPQARDIPEFKRRFSEVNRFRSESTLDSTRQFAREPYRFVYLAGMARDRTIAVASVSSERREHLPVDVFHAGTTISNLAFALYDAPLWNLALIASSLHLVWIATVCGKMKTDFRYSNTLGWNTFPVPILTDKNMADLTRCAEHILLTREAHFPATIADLYNPDEMPADVRDAHERNDDVIERIYVGRRFRNDTERLEKLFELYTKMTAGHGAAAKPKAGADA